MKKGINAERCVGRVSLFMTVGLLLVKLQAQTNGAPLKAKQIKRFLDLDRNQMATLMELFDRDDWYNHEPTKMKAESILFEQIEKCGIQLPPGTIEQAMRSTRGNLETLH